MRKKVYFLNLGNSSIAGGFSSYSRFISELNISEHLVKFSDFGTEDKNSVNLFFRTVGLEKINFYSYLLHRINQLVYFILFFALLVICLWSESKIWIQSSFISRSKILRFLAFKLGRKHSLIIDVRDKEFFPFIDMFSNFKFISCGTEITEKIYLSSNKVFNLSTPISSEDVKLINTIKTGNYVVYAHGIQKDKSPEELLKFLEMIDTSDYLLVLCGRIRTNSNVLVKEIIQHKKLRYVGVIHKIVLLALLKDSGGVLITSEDEGVPRILEEAKNFSVPIISSQNFSYLTDYKNLLTFKEFEDSIVQKSEKKYEYKSHLVIRDKLQKFIFGE